LFSQDPSKEFAEKERHFEFESGAAIMDVMELRKTYLAVECLKLRELDEFFDCSLTKEECFEILMEKPTEDLERLLEHLRAEEEILPR